MQGCSHLRNRLYIYNSHALEGPLFLCFPFETYITYLQNFLSVRTFTSQNEITTWTLIPHSRAILGYLVEQYAKDDSLYPKNPKKRAVVNQMLYFDATTLYQRILNYYVSNVQILFKINGSYINTCCILLQPTNAQIYITILSQAAVTRDCVCSHINTLLSKDFVSSHRLCCITQRRPNDILIKQFYRMWIKRPTRCQTSSQPDLTAYTATALQHTWKIPLSRQLLKMGTRRPETCWANYKGEINILLSDI